MEEADGDRLDPVGRELRRDGPPLGRVERTQHRAVGGHALVHLVTAAARDERRRLAPEGVVHVRDPQAAQLEHVAEPCGRDQGRHGAAALEHGVRGHGRPVDDGRQLLRVGR